MGRSPVWKWLVLLILIIGLMIFWVSPLRPWLTDHQRWVHLIEEGGMGAFLAAHVTLTVMGIPGTVLAVTGGLVFGAAWGTVLSVVGGTLGAIAAFSLARYYGHSWAERRFGQHKRLHWFRRSVEQRPLSFVLAVRFFPISPFTIVNFLFGLTPIALKPYAIGTALGILPGTILYASLGAAGKTALTTGQMKPFFLAVFLLSLLAIAPLIYEPLRQRFKP